MSDPKGPGGRPPFQPTPEQRHTVLVMAANGTSHGVMAQVIGITRKTLAKHFRAELTDALETLTARMGLTIVRAGLRGDWRAAAFWLARFARDPRWKQPSLVAVSGTVRVAMEQGEQRDPSTMTDEEIRDELAAIERAKAALTPTDTTATVH